MTRQWTTVDDGDGVAEVGVGAGFATDLFIRLRDNHHASRMFIGTMPIMGDWLDTSGAGGTIRGYRNTSAVGSGNAEDLLREVEFIWSDGPWHTDQHMFVHIPDMGGATPFSGITWKMRAGIYCRYNGGPGSGYAYFYDVATGQTGTVFSTDNTNWPAWDFRIPTWTLPTTWYGTTREWTIYGYTDDGGDFQICTHQGFNQTRPLGGTVASRVSSLYLEW